jgi:ubiquinone/menaquinone biosynthesis C-methylase UbiE
MIHHLASDPKREAFRDVKRLLRAGGRFHVLDFGPPRGVLDRLLAAVLHHGEQLRDNLDGRLLEWLREAGFADAREVESHRTAFGRVALYSGRAPE